MMPVLNGAELIAALQAEAAAHGRASPSIVLLTAGSALAVSHLHMDTILFKPFDLGKLAQAIHQLLGP